MGYSLIIEQTLERLGISIEEAAAFVGTNANHIDDLVSYDDELTTTLSITQVCRLCGLLRLKPHELLNQEPPLRHISPSELRGRVLQDSRSHEWSIEEFSEQVGWEMQGLIDAPDNFVLSLNLDGLQMICGYLGLNTIEAIPQPVAA